MLESEWLKPATRPGHAAQGYTEDAPRDISAIIADLQLLEAATAEQPAPEPERDEYDDRDEKKEIRGDLAAIFRAGAHVGKPLSSVKIWDAVEPLDTWEESQPLLNAADLWNIPVEQRLRFASGMTRRWKAAKLARLQRVLSKYEEANSTLRSAAAGAV